MLIVCMRRCADPSLSARRMPWVGVDAPLQTANACRSMNRLDVFAHTSKTAHALVGRWKAAEFSLDCTAHLCSRHQTSLQPANEKQQMPQDEGATSACAFPAKCAWHGLPSTVHERQGNALPPACSLRWRRLSFDTQQTRLQRSRRPEVAPRGQRLLPGRSRVLRGWLWGRGRLSVRAVIRTSRMRDCCGC